MNRYASIFLAAIALSGCTDGGNDGAQDLATVDSTPAPQPVLAVVRGTLKDGDVKAMHDAIVANSKAIAQAAGDTGHVVFLGLADAHDFMAIDHWNDQAGATATYSNPAYVSAFGALFTAAPTIEFVAVADGYSSWGSFDPAQNGLPLFAFSVEGTLASTDPAANRAAHNAIAEGGKAMAMAMTDIAHLPNLEVGQPRQFFNVDLWQDIDKAQMVLGSPQYMAAFSTLFSGAPTVKPYVGTDFAQW